MGDNGNVIVMAIRSDTRWRYGDEQSANEREVEARGIVSIATPRHAMNEGVIR